MAARIMMANTSLPALRTKAIELAIALEDIKTRPQKVKAKTDAGIKKEPVRMTPATWGTQRCKKRARAIERTPAV